jgi:hypothetical protein
MRRLLQLGAGAALLCAAMGARADALGELKAALARGAVQAPVRAAVETQTWRKLGEGDDAEEVRGQASVLVDDGARGLSVTHAREVMVRMERELQARARDANSKTPTLSALDDLGPRDLAALTSAAATLGRALERGVFKGERADTWQGKPARALSFEMPITTLSDRERKYAKKFSSLLEVWIGADGMPLASRARVSASGRAFIVIGFEFGNDEDSVYGMADGRLVTLRRESRSRFSGPGERDERKVVTTLQPQT